ncbi:MAG TPA: hypothetical protein VFG78_03440 [Gemmatimonadota bacterium]|nr:hypothetical protein [Gemmatimonadota bacterium]
MAAFPLFVLAGVWWVLLQRMALVASARIELELADPAEVDAKTRRRVARFSELGYRELAVYRAHFRRAGFNLVVMAGPDGASWAEVTDKLWEMTSAFGHRLMITASHRMIAPQPATLVQCIPRGAPDTILDEHRRALASLAQRGLLPDRLTDDEALARFESATRDAQAKLRRSMWRTTLDVAWRRPLQRHHGRPALAEDPRAGARIDDWLAAR